VKQQPEVLLSGNAYGTEKVVYSEGENTEPSEIENNLVYREPWSEKILLMSGFKRPDLRER
jgi:hypothetical protein